MTTDEGRGPSLERRPSYPVSLLGIARHVGLRTLLPISKDGEPIPSKAFYEPTNGDLRVEPEGGSKTFRQDFDENFFLAWPPNLFALTSLYFETTGAYALATVEAVRENARAPYQALWSETLRKGMMPFLSAEWQRLVQDAAVAWRAQLYVAMEKDLNRQVILGSLPSRKRGAPGGDELERLAKKFPGRSVPPATCPPLTLLDADGKPLDQYKVALAGLAEACPPVARELWGVVRACMPRPREADPSDIYDLDALIHQGPWTQKALFQCLWTLHAMADMTCLGWGIRHVPLDPEKKLLESLEGSVNGKHPTGAQARRLRDRWSEVDEFFKAVLSLAGTLSFISPDRLCIVPKRHTPSVGTSLRACASSLAFHRSAIDIVWETDAQSIFDPDSMEAATQRGDGEVNILLLPWPMQVRAVDFCSSRASGGKPGEANPRENLRSFSYIPDPAHPARARADVRRRPGDGPEPGSTAQLVAKQLGDVLTEALKECDSIDMVVLPEGALSDDSATLDAFERILDAAGVKTYIAGTWHKQPDGGTNGDQTASPPRTDSVSPVIDPKERGSNKLCFGYRAASTDPSQRYKRAWYEKHHRWTLNEFQIKAYNLGGQLSPSAHHVELIDIPRRRAALFVNLGDQLTVCPIICEDLARQESLAELIRSVGPSLVVSVLLDGPQKRDRWSARYASAFSEDPGCSVLALTSYGMVKRWTGPEGLTSQAIALWSDRDGRPTEINLKEGALGVLLGLAVKPVKERTIDSRRENVATFALTLGAQIQVFPPKGAP